MHGRWLQAEIMRVAAKAQLAYDPGPQTFRPVTPNLRRSAVFRACF